MDEVYVIAEAGVNHNGCIETAIALVDVAAAAGANAVKFQKFVAQQLVSAIAPKADYQKALTDTNESQYDMLKKLEIDIHGLQRIEAYCKAKSIDFLCTPFDHKSLHELVSHCDMRFIKVSSGDISNAPLLLEMAKTGMPIILSTGMSTVADIERALMIICFGMLKESGKPTEARMQSLYRSDPGQKVLRKNLTLLHCTTEYPAPIEEVNLSVLGTLSRKFNVRVGYSDHTKGIIIPIAAVAMGATVIEKHITLDCTMDGPDHKASIEPEQLQQMVLGIREVTQAVGDGVKRVSASELKNIDVARRSIVARKAISKGETFSETNLICKRPGSGLSPFRYWEVLGKVATKDYQKDELIDG